jgi:hypothetical protein
MDLDEVVGEIIQSHGSGVILQFAAESIRQSCVAPQRRADRPVLPFNKRSRNMLWVRVSPKGKVRHAQALSVKHRQPRQLAKYRHYTHLALRWALECNGLITTGTLLRSVLLVRQ